MLRGKAAGFGRIFRPIRNNVMSKRPTPPLTRGSGARTFPEESDAALQCDHIIADFFEIFGTAIDNGACLGRQQFPERGLRAFDLAGQDRLAPYEGTPPDVRIGQPPAFSGKPANEPVRLREHANEPRRPL
jgi:hypothetical protein